MRISRMRVDATINPLLPAWLNNRSVHVGRMTRFVALSLLCLVVTCPSHTYGQETDTPAVQMQERAHAEVCPDPPPQTSGSHGFRRVGETIDIPINVADCQPVAFVLRWSNGRSHGSSLVVTFLDSMNQPIHTRSLSGFLSGSFEFPFDSLDPQPWFARGSLVAVPKTIVIQALAPFAPPANISYSVIRKGTRIGTRPRAATQTIAQPSALPRSQPLSGRVPILDNDVAMKLRTAEGRLLSQGQISWASKSAEALRYKLKELVLPEPGEITINGRKEIVEVAYRLTFARGDVRGSQNAGAAPVPALSQFGLIWLDDAPLPAFSNNPQEISTLIFDPSVLRDGAQIAVSRVDGSEMHSLVERLSLASMVQRPTSNSNDGSSVQSGRSRDQANEVVEIRNGVRVVGSTRIPLVQIELRTNRPFPPRDSVLQLQIGKQFFLNELTGDHTGRTLTLILTEAMFAELRQGAEIVAFFDKPDRSGFSPDVWHFGRLDKSKRR